MLEIKTNEDLINLCFKDEKEPPEKPGINSILFLLRREIKHCFGIKPETGESNGVYAKWPGTMAIMAGVDLLAKYSAGSLDVSGSGKRFKEFLGSYWRLNENDREIIYQLRNALMHSFALYAIDLKTKKEFKFSLTEGSKKLIIDNGGNNYTIDIDELLCYFFLGYENYKNTVLTNDELKTKLVFVFCKIGAITM